MNAEVSGEIFLGSKLVCEVSQGNAIDLREEDV
jgi:hypothetical protein